MDVLPDVLGDGGGGGDGSSGNNSDADDGGPAGNNVHTLFSIMHCVTKLSSLIWSCQCRWDGH